ncbi:pyrroline-5-carboxylate reductase [Nocardioides sp. BE266]|uniref:NAD(P)-binding domain-containing protein n=1 Tax=Nocardioides sp. BE266 TaxID=2817725 RepID=UPI00285CA545|nr:NAD(P)-binding domain-containing protein [Nocardioides sp. BE266]MDR7254766.1 pyrroline-5-carboxylate reductase [Nocardioides sp. BE266]
MTTYGVLGVGSIAEAIVTGLCSVDAPPEVVLSPRNAERSARLAARFATVRVADDNQAVVDAADVVVVCLLPQQADVLAGLAFRPEHRVVSAVAGLSMARLGELVAPATEVARSVPLPAVATRSSTTPIHPPRSVAEDLYSLLGGTLPVEDERAYESLSAASATVAAHLDYLGTIAAWVGGHGIEDAQARKYVADLFADLAPELRTPGVDFADLAAAHSTPGGLNAQLAAHLRDAGLLDALRSGLDDLLDRIAPRGA